MDRFSRWPEAIPLPSSDVTAITNAFITQWISRYGLPQHITSDQGTQFTSAIWRQFADMNGIALHFTTAYHPQSNGLLERWHRTLKQAIRARCENANWMNQLPWVMLGLRVSPALASGISPAQVLFGRTLSVPGQFLPTTEVQEPHPDFLTSLQNTLTRIPPPPVWNRQQKVHTPSTLKAGGYCFLRNEGKTGLELPYRGPYRLERLTAKKGTINMDGDLVLVSIDRLKPAVYTTDWIEAQNFPGPSQ